ncbi:MAG: DNRLRE domain-containing protein [Acidobacteriota bacterium]|nr:DNRLRE domain-containing protein [Acidobacteriota bacterium]
MRFSVIAVLALCLCSPIWAETVTIEASRDTTLIEEPDGALADGSGPALRVGKTGEGSVRRALLYFDVASALPPKAIVESVELTIHMEPSHAELREYRLHRVLADWGEGASATGGGQGAPAAPGDATWIHTFYDNEFWTHSGGQFAGQPSATNEIAGPAAYTWESTRRLVRDVRRWKSSPRTNHGWILIGGETARNTAKRFASRENADPALRPVLEITYRTRD